MEGLETDCCISTAKGYAGRGTDIDFDPSELLYRDLVLAHRLQNAASGPERVIYRTYLCGTERN